MIYLNRVKSLHDSHIRKSKLADRSGQATMEYILLLVITVSLVLSLTNQFFKPFGKFINNYMGDYISCLLETGEYPSTGTSSTKSECDVKFDPASFGNGRPAIAGAGSNPNDPEGRKAGKDRESGSAGGQGGYAGSAGSRASNLSGPPPSLPSGDKSGGTKVVEISIGTTEEAGFNKAGSGRNFDSQGQRRAGGVISYSLSSGEQKKVEDEKKAASRVIASDLPGRSPKKLFLKAQIKADAIAEDKSEEWNIGDYFRFLLIAAIIILLIAVIGGQAARLTKSWE